MYQKHPSLLTGRPALSLDRDGASSRPLPGVTETPAQLSRVSRRLPSLAPSGAPSRGAGSEHGSGGLTQPGSGGTAAAPRALPMPAPLAPGGGGAAGARSPWQRADAAAPLPPPPPAARAHRPLAAPHPAGLACRVTARPRDAPPVAGVARGGRAPCGLRGNGRLSRRAPTPLPARSHRRHGSRRRGRRCRRRRTRAGRRELPPVSARPAGAVWGGSAPRGREGAWRVGLPGRAPAPSRGNSAAGVGASPPSRGTAEHRANPAERRSSGRGLQHVMDTKRLKRLFSSKKGKAALHHHL
ncbi:uncharacterized protein ACIQIH_008559 [Cyanocitta cristata]